MAGCISSDCNDENDTHKNSSHSRKEIRRRRCFFLSFFLCCCMTVAKQITLLHICAVSGTRVKYTPDKRTVMSWYPGPARNDKQSMWTLREAQFRIKPRMLFAWGDRISCTGPVDTYVNKFYRKVRRFGRKFQGRTISYTKIYNLK